MKIFFRHFVLITTILLVLPVSQALPQTSENYIVKYYQAYKKGNLLNASEVMAQSLLSEKSLLAYCSGATAMIHTFPDMSRMKDLEFLINKLKTTGSMTDNHEAMNFTDNLLLGMELIQGNFSAAEKIKKNLGWIENYKIIGPFDYKDISEFENMDIQFLNKPYILNSRNSSAEWFDVRSSRDGEIDFNYLFRRQSQDIYFAQFSASVESGIHYLYICKTGPFEIYIDGKKIFADYSLHKSFPGQYVVQVNLTKGSHSMLMNISGNSDNETSFGIQMKNAEFKPVDTFADAKLISGNAPSEYKSWTGLGIDFNSSGQDETFLINQGFLLQAMAYQDKDVTAVSYLNLIPQESNLYSYAQTLCALSETSLEKKDFYLRNAIKSDDENVAAKHQLFSMLLYNGFIYEASAMLNGIIGSDENSVFALSSKTAFYTEKGWYDKAYDELAKIRKYMSHADALLFESMIEVHNKNYKRLVEIYRELNKLNRYSRDYAEVQLDYMLQVSSPEEVSSQAAKFAGIFYNYTVFDHKAASASMYEGLNNKALMYLAASQKKCRYNSYTDFYFSKVYEMTGQKSLAAVYLKQASLKNPAENYFAEYYEFAYKSSDSLLKYKYDVDFARLSSEAEQYNNEPAVTLFDENIEKVMSDGSVMKSVRTAYKIFNPENIKPLMQQAFVFSPSDDEILSVSCSIEKNGEIINVKEIDYQELSSPESRLYYDSTAAVIYLPELEANSVVYFNYLIHSKASSEFRGYYSSSKRFNNQYRILTAVNKIIAPTSLTLSHQLKNSSNAEFKKIAAGNEIIYSYINKNIIPVLQEQKMLPASERYPSVSFSSFKDWTEFHKWYRQLFEKQIVMSEQMKTDIDSVVKNAKTDEEKIDAVYQYITDRIRYVGYEIGIGGIKPRRSDVVYQTRLGDCKDIALLLTAAFRYLKMEAALALVVTADSGFTDEKFASIGNFNHAICCVTLPEKGKVFLDGTVKQAGSKELVSSDMQTVSLVLTEKSFEFVKIESSYYYPFIEKDEDIVEIYENGNARITKKSRKTNDSAINMRSMKDGNVNIETRISRGWNSIFPGSALSGFQFISFEKNKPVEYKYNVDIMGFAEIVGNEMFIPVIAFKYQFLQDYGIAAARMNDVYVSDTENFENSFVFNIPANYEISFLPPSRKFTFGKNTVHFSIEKDNLSKNRINVTYNIHFEHGVIPASEYRQFRQYIIELEKIEALKIVLKEKADK